MAFKWLSKLTQGLTKTRSKLADGVKALFRIGRKVDKQFLEELEETLILGDVGVAATKRIVEDLKTRYRDREIAADDDLLGVIKSDLKAGLGEGGLGTFNYNPDGPTVIMVVGVNGSGKTTAVATPGAAVPPGGEVGAAGGVRHVSRGRRRAARHLERAGRRRHRPAQAGGRSRRRSRSTPPWRPSPARSMSSSSIRPAACTRRTT